jgi:hypothetical protein
MISLKLEDLRKYRFLSLSAIDFFGTIVITILILCFFKKCNVKNIITFSTLSIILGVVVHRLLGIDTQLNRYIFRNRPIQAL